MSPQALGARHQRVQRLRRLVQRSTTRRAEQAFVAEGLKVVGVALDAGAPVESVFIAAQGRENPAVASLADRALDAGARVFDLGAGIMERVADTVNPQGVCAVVGSIDVGIDALLASTAAATGHRVLIVCVDVRDPGNLGAVIRSGAAAGATGIVCCSGTVDPFNPKTVRASAGAIFHLPVTAAGAPEEVLSSLKTAGFRLVATTARDGTDYLDASFEGDVAIVLGNEASGLPSDVAASLDERVTIAMSEATESLNVAMTATVLCFEIARRRRPGAGIA